MRNPYTIAFAIGYFYGRAYPTDAATIMPEHDLYHREHQGFIDGLNEGRRDYQDVDLPIIALSQPQDEQ